MTIVTQTFRSGNSQAVRLPKEVAFEDDTEIEIIRSGEVVMLRPHRKRLTPPELVAELRKVGRPSYVQEREPFDFPDLDIED